ncbi:DUF2637 domain-containing protein [Streptomyces chryseus]|uniref:DUF2637 domain-containing protein n=1 Tax=Streptomyces chryseus TaxID=68186 RepID=UPI0019973FA0|nr:DUF2637 domain-containing protein [Streptomyces chryseus]GGX09541.1 hypothetical protein GCM10010353_26200 [Streptomyces chryseus]
MHDGRGRHSRVGPPDGPGSTAAWSKPADGYPQAGFWNEQPAPLDPLGPLDMPWDPAEELAHLLQEAIQSDHDPSGHAPSADPDAPPVADADAPLEGLTRITAELPAVRSVPRRRRRALSRKRTAGALRTISFFLAALAAVIVSMVCVFGGMVTYDPLRHLARYRTAKDAVTWWPVLVYGPWMVASLSILRAALHQRRAVHSWTVVLLFSTVSILLCVSQAPRTVVDVAAAALPSLAALACFQQLVRQITLTRPPRQAAPRHRSPTSAPQRSAGQNRPPT